MSALIKDRVVNVVFNKDEFSNNTFAFLKERLEENGFTVSETFKEDAEITVCIGGDGSFLRTVHKNKFPTIPFIGINTGHLGFFQELQPRDIDIFIDDYVNRRYSVESLLLIDTHVITKDDNYNILSVNEAVIKGVKSKVVKLDIYVDDNHLETFYGDGLIISTPVGSTAYNFSVGGSIVYPKLESLQIAPIAPISSKAFRSLTNSIVIPRDFDIKIVPETKYEKSILIVDDGEEIKYDDIKEINIKMSYKKIYRLLFDKNTYWNNLKDKFL